MPSEAVLIFSNVSVPPLNLQRQSDFKYSIKSVYSDSARSNAGACSQKSRSLQPCKQCLTCSDFRRRLITGM
jgi:hypothetical protein